MTAPGAVEERGLVDDVGAGGHRGDRLVGGRPQLVAAVLDGPVEGDLDDRPPGGLEVGAVARLVVEAAMADDVELGVVAHRPMDEPGERGALELGQVLAGEVADEIGGGVDGPAVDRLHLLTLPRVDDTSPVTGRVTLRAMTGSSRQGPSDRDPMRRWESLVERQIREAADEGKFDDLPHQGRPLPLEDDSAAGEWAMAYRMLKDAGAAPPWIEADKAVRSLMDGAGPAVGRGGRGRRRSAGRGRGRRMPPWWTRLNAAIARVNAEAPTDRQHRRSLDREAELAVFDGRRSTP